jgi:retron-type reverse transcriptase
VIQQALAQVLEPLFDPGFSVYRYGFRKRRGAHEAVQQANAYGKQGYARPSAARVTGISPERKQRNGE